MYDGELTQNLSKLAGNKVGAVIGILLEAIRIARL